MWVILEMRRWIFWGGRRFDMEMWLIISLPTQTFTLLWGKSILKRLKGICSPRQKIVKRNISAYMSSREVPGLRGLNWIVRKSWQFAGLELIITIWIPAFTGVTLLDTRTALVTRLCTTSIASCGPKRSSCTALALPWWGFRRSSTLKYFRASEETLYWNYTSRSCFPTR